jgi:hypothetical protein
MPEGPAFWGALVAWLASPAIYYSLVSPAYSHAPSLFASALFCDIWLRTRGDDRSRRYVWLGLAGGLAALVRWQDIVILGLPGIELLVAHLGRRRTLVSLLRPVALMGLAALVMMLPQMLAWHAIFGTVFLMPQGEGFMKWTSPQIIAVLFSLRHGLISWTPAIGLGLVGLWFLIRRDPVVGWSVLAVFLITVYVNASVSDWWAGEAFGARRFVGNTVFFALGLSAFFSADVWRNRPVLLRWIAALLILYNVLFLLQYELAMHGVFVLAPYPSTLQQVLLDRMTLPFRLGAWLTR